MKIDFKILLIIMLFSFTACASLKAPLTPQQEADLLYTEASELHESESYDEASARFEEYAIRFPESISADNAKLQVANNHFQQGRYDQALAEYQGIVDVYPESDASDHALLLIGDVYFTKQEYPEAIEAYEKLLKKYPRFGIRIADEAQERLDAVEDLKENMRILEEGPDDAKDNAQYDIADIYFTIFRNYERAKEEFQKVVDIYPNSEMADNALWQMGECYWNIAKLQLPPKGFSQEQLAYIKLMEIYDKYPQLTKIKLFHLDVHWPAGKRGDDYELAYAQVRRIVNKYPGIQDKRATDFLPENYAKAFETWHNVISNYPHTDTAYVAMERIAYALAHLGNTYYNMGEKHFGSILLMESILAKPTIEGHLGAARYYANLTTVSPQAWAYRRAFFHIKKAEEMTPPDSPMAERVGWAKEWMNYKMRIEALESWPEKR